MEEIRRKGWEWGDVLRFRVGGGDQEGVKIGGGVCCVTGWVEEIKSRGLGLGGGFRKRK